MSEIATASNKLGSKEGTKSLLWKKYMLNSWCGSPVKSIMLDGILLVGYVADQSRIYVYVSRLNVLAYLGIWLLLFEFVSHC